MGQVENFLTDSKSYWLSFSCFKVKDKTTQNNMQI